MSNVDFAGRLLNGEQVLWSGQPQRGLLLLARDGFAVPFLLVWCGLLIFMGVKATESRNTPAMTYVVLAVMALFGFFGLVGRFVIDAWLRSKTVYALTNRRILIVRPGLFGVFTTLNLDPLPALQLTERANGRGTIRFGPPVSNMLQNNWSMWLPVLDQAPQFLAIENARSIFDQINQATTKRG